MVKNMGKAEKSSSMVMFTLENGKMEEEQAKAATNLHQVRSIKVKSGIVNLTGLGRCLEKASSTSESLKKVNVQDSVN